MRPAAKNQNRDIGLRERLVQQLVEGSLECLICLENVRPKHAVFDCQECYQVFHIHCIKKWSKTAKNEGKGINMVYRVTIHFVSNLELTSKQKFCFSMRPMY